MINRDIQVLILGTADWNQPIATNQHYMVRELSKDYGTTFVESLGLRRPEISLKDINRMISRLTPYAAKNSYSRVVPANVSIIKPLNIPLHHTPWKQANQRILNRLFKEWSRKNIPLLWTYSPVTYGFESKAKAAIYHCVDLYAEFPGIDSELINSEEQRLARTGTTAIGSSEIVVEHLRKQGFGNVIYWPNVADTSNIKKYTTINQSRSGFVFAGNLSEKKVDFGLLNRIVREGYELHLAGPISEGGGEGKVRVEELVSLGAKYHGVLDMKDLAKLMSTSMVGLIPYLFTSYTRGVSPLKTYEYLAAGLTVISTGVPSVENIEGHVYTSADNNAFMQQVAISTKPTPGQINERMALADSHSWDSRGLAARRLIAQLIDN